MSIVINYQQLKLFIIAIRNLNSNFTPSNRLHMDGNRLPAVIERFNSNLKPVINYTSLVIDYQRRFSKYFARITSVQMVFEWPSKVYLYVTWNTNLLRAFLNKKSYPLKRKIVLSSKTFLG